MDDELLVDLPQKTNRTDFSETIKAEPVSTIPNDIASLRERKRRENFKRPYDWYKPTREEDDDFVFDYSPPQPSPEYVYYKRRQYLDNLLAILDNEELFNTNLISFFDLIVDIVRASKKEFINIEAEVHFLDILENVELTVLTFSGESKDFANKIRKILKKLFKDIRTEKMITLRHDEDFSSILFANKMLVTPLVSLIESDEE